MLRPILGVIVGFITMAAIVFVGLAVAYVVVGEDKAYVTGGWDVSTLWIAVSIIVGFVAAIVAGAVCKMIARAQKAAMALVVVVLVLGGFSAVMEIMKEVPENPPVRVAPTAMTDAMQYSKQPTWVAVANPIFGAIGVLIGASMIKGREGAAG